MPEPMRRGLVYGSSALGALVGAAYSYAFGRQISGPGLGVLLALNAGVFGGLVVGMVLDRLLPASRGNRENGENGENSETRETRKERGKQAHEPD